MKLTKTIIEIVLSIIIGGAVGFALFLMSYGLCVIVGSAIVAFILSSIVAGVTEGNELSKLLCVFTFIAAFILYFCLLGYINDSSNVSMFFGTLVFLLPYIVITYIILVAAEKRGD